MGQAIGMVMKALGGKAEGGVVAKVVKDILQGSSL
jgi:Asp-tRNA(Asn)/Glu-tRNA(Gln) amidotransferase B subunit